MLGEVLAVLAVAYTVLLPVTAFRFPTFSVFFGIAVSFVCALALLICFAWNAGIDEFAQHIGLRPDLHPFAIAFEIKFGWIYFVGFLGTIFYTMLSMVATANIIEYRAKQMDGR